MGRRLLLIFGMVLSASLTRHGCAGRATKHKDKKPGRGSSVDSSSTRMRSFQRYKRNAAKEDPAIQPAQTGSSSERDWGKFRGAGR